MPEKSAFNSVAVLWLAGCLFMVTGMAQPVEASPLDGKPAVLNQKLMREGRVELMPRFGVTVYDAYERSLFTGFSVNYFFLDWLSIGVDLQYAFSVDTALHEQIDRELQSKRNTVCPETGDAAARIDCLSALGVAPSIGTSSIELVAIGNLSFLPISGKLMVFGNLLRYDVHILAGAGIGMTRAEGSNDVIEETLTVAPMAGIGLRVLFNDWMGINLEVQDILLQYHEATNQSGDLLNSRFHNHFEISLGISFLLPTTPGFDITE